MGDFSPDFYSQGPEILEKLGIFTKSSGYLRNFLAQRLFEDFFVGWDIPE